MAKNKIKEKNWEVYLIFIMGILFIIIILGLAYNLYKHTKLTEEYFEIKLDLMKQCAEIQGCERHSCLAILSTDLRIKQILLLREQNCLLREEKTAP